MYRSTSGCLAAKTYASMTCGSNRSIPAGSSTHSMFTHAVSAATAGHAQGSTSSPRLQAGTATARAMIAPAWSRSLVCLIMFGHLHESLIDQIGQQPDDFFMTD